MKGFAMADNEDPVIRVNHIVGENFGCMISAIIGFALARNHDMVQFYISQNPTNTCITAQVYAARSDQVGIEKLKKINSEDFDVIDLESLKPSIELGNAATDKQIKK